MNSHEQKLVASKQPTAFLIFGGTGDVAKLKLYPALYHLAVANLLPRQFYVFGVARRKVSDAAYKKVIENAIRKSEGKKLLDQKALEKVLKHAKFYSGDLTKRDIYDQLEAHIQGKENKMHKPIQRIFYLGLPPKVFPYVFANVQTCKLGSALCTLSQVLSRIIIEKPFGYDLQSAKKLQRDLRKAFDERQIYRMDHYLGKEAMQNILLFRFGNAIFDQLWHSGEIRSVQITALETLGVEDRANYYEEAGATRDFIQNHLLQMLAYATMPQTKTMDEKEIHQAKEKILAATSLYKSRASKTKFVRGQYKAGRVENRKVKAYRSEPNVVPRSNTETYAAVKLGVNTLEWRGVPFYIRTGKRCSRKVSEITYLFRRPAELGFLDGMNAPVRSSFVTVRLEPDPGISIRVNVKRPGYSMELAPADLHFCYQETFGANGVGAYERLLLEVIAGNQLLFASGKEVEESWRIVDPMIQAFEKNKSPLNLYEAGTTGPKQSDAMLAEEGERWINDTLDICKRSHRE